MIRTPLASRLLAPLLLVALLLTVPAAAQAHHGWSGYDLSKEFTVNAVIKELTFDWPHVSVLVETTDNARQKWTATLAPPSRMETRGAPAKLIQVGTAVKLTGYPNRTTPQEFRAERIWIGDQKVELR